MKGTLKSGREQRATRSTRPNLANKLPNTNAGRLSYLPPFMPGRK
jgi:hypothetical protein